MLQGLTVFERPLKVPKLHDLPKGTEAYAARVSVVWSRTWELAVEFGAPATMIGNPVFDYELDFRVGKRARQVDVLLISFGERFMTGSRIREWARRNGFYRFLHPRAILAFEGGEMVESLASHLERTGRVGMVSLTPVIEHEGEERVCTLYYRYDKARRIMATLELDRLNFGWSRDHFIGFDITEGEELS